VPGVCAMNTLALRRLGITAATPDRIGSIWIEKDPSGECLDFLLEAGTATAGQIADQTNLTTGAVTSMIRRLQRAGYVTASRDPADRRRVIVTPVPDKLTAAAEVYAAYLRQADALIQAYTDDQLAFLTSHYQNLTAIYRDVIREHGDG
jgi:MarR family transcriptional regulator, organic hydroperoxide resistance regulator